ncbi:MAG: acyltransferase [Saprospiraceae bacterium]|nr:acyltransferase [Saprospiraceae bacterium]
MNPVSQFLISHQNRIIGLDIIRCLAILRVVYGHGYLLLPEAFHQTYRNIMLLNLDGVSIFFMLSGFLIGGILLKSIHTREFGLREIFIFWIRRWFRTIPNYVLVLSSVWLYNMFIGFTSPEKGFFYYLTFSQNFFSPHPDWFPEAWSLAVEEWFYVFFPLSYFIFYLFIKSKEKLFLFTTVLFIIFPLVLRVFKYNHGLELAEFDLEFRKIMLLRLDSIMYGVLAAYLLFKKPAFWEKYKYLFLYTGIVFLLLLKWKSGTWVRDYPPLTFNIESAIIFCFLPFMANYKTTKLKYLDAAIIFISIISYSMYLINLQVIGILIPTLSGLMFGETGSHWINYAMYWILTIILSWMLYKWFEKPITDLRDKIGLNKVKSM